MLKSMTLLGCLLFLSLNVLAANKYEESFKKSDSYKRMEKQDEDQRKRDVYIDLKKHKLNNSKSNNLLWDFNFHYDYGDTPLGQYRDSTFHLQPTDQYVVWMFTLNQTGSNDFTVIDDACSATGVTETHGCSVTIRFTPSSIGNKSSDFIYTIASYYDGEYIGNYTFTYSLTGSSFKYCPDCMSTSGGSIIKIDTRTVSEVVPVVGTNFDMVFSSDFSQTASELYPSIPSTSVYNKQAWNPSIYHYYDHAANRLFLGSGSIASRRNFVESDFATNTNKYRVISPDSSELYYFDSNGQHLETRSALTGALIYSFTQDENGYLSQITDSFGNVTVFNRDSNNYLTSVVSPFGKTTTFLTNTSGKFSSITNPNNETYSFTYNANGNLLTFTKPGGQVTSLTYDTGEKLTKDLGNGGNFWNLIESISGQISKTSQMGRTSNYSTSYDQYNNYSKTESEDNGLTTYSYQNPYGGFYSGNPIEQITRETTNDSRFGYSVDRTSLTKLKINGNERVTNYSQNTDASDPSTPFNYTYLNKSVTTSGRTATNNFNKTNLTFTQTSPGGVITKTILDANEHPVSYKYGNDRPITFNYDSQGRLIETKQGNRNQYSFAYDASGYLQSVTDGFSRTTSYVRDLAGRITSVIYPDARTVSYTFDANGNVTSVTPPNRPAHFFEFNAMELPSKYSPADLPNMTAPKDTEYVYNLDKQQTQTTYPTGQVVNYNYNQSRGVLDSISTSIGDYSYTYQNDTPRMDTAVTFYNAKNIFSYYGNTIQSNEQINSTNNFSYGKVSFGFDVDHRMISRSVQGTTTEAVDTANITLNADGNPTQYGDMALTYEAASGRLLTTTLDKVTDSRTYDIFGNLESYTASYNGNPIYSYTLTRDKMNKIIGISEMIQGATKEITYTYDRSNRLKTVSENGVQTASFTYNANGNRTSTTIDTNTYEATYDAQDRMKSYGTNVYSYNKRGDLTQIEDSLSNTTKFTFDPLGNLNKILYPNNSVSRYWYNGLNQVFAKYYPNSFRKIFLYQDQYRIAAMVKPSGIVQQYYYYATNSMTPDYIKIGAVNYRVISDHLGSPRLVVKVTNGTVMQRISYNVLGKVTEDTSPLYQPFGFAGGLYDAESSLVHFGARKYDTFVGRWISKDPILFNGGDTNLYGYTGNDPVNWVDPSGMWGVTISGTIGGFLGGGYDISGGIYFGYQNGSFLGGVFGSGGAGFGIGAGAGVSATYYPNACSISGSSTTMNGQVGLITGNVVTNQTTGAVIGYGGGIATPGRGASVVFTNTGIIGKGP